MKKAVLGATLQLCGFLGTIMIIITTAPEDYYVNEMHGLHANLIAMNLLLPLVICICVFLIGLLISLKDIYKKS